MKVFEQTFKKPHKEYCNMPGPPPSHTLCNIANNPFCNENTCPN